MIEHKEHVGVEEDGHHTLEAAPERKALPPAPPPPPPRRRRSRAWLWLLLLAVVGLIAFRSYQGVESKKAAEAAAQEKRAANRAITVAATAAQRGDMPIYLRGLGNVVAYNTVNLKPRVDGPIVAVNFKEGQFVHKDEVLVEIDPRTFQAALDQAKGQLARDQAQLNDARVNLARYQKLWDEQVIAKQQLDTQAAQVGQFQGTIEADRATIESAQLNLSFARVRAPIAGRIGLRQVDIGNIVHATDANPLAVITQMQPISVLFTIPADQLQPVLAKLRAGAKLPVFAFDRADVRQIAAGSLETVDNQIDPNTGTSRLKAVFNNQDNALFPQQFVNCRLLLETRHGVVLIPMAAVQLGPQGPYVYVVDGNGAANMRQITEGPTEGNRVQVTSGLAPGDMVITDGQDKLQEGSKVMVRGGGADSGAGAGGWTQGGRGGRNAAGAQDITGTVNGTGGPAGQGNYTGNSRFTGTNNAGGVPGGRAGHSGDQNPNNIPSGRQGGPGSQPSRGPQR